MLRKSLIAFLFLVGAAGLTGCDPAGSANWPPKVDQLFPELTLINHDGRKFRLSDLKGKVVLVEPIGMTCEACNAFSGGNRRGGFKWVKPQQGLQSIEQYLARYSNGVTLSHDDLVMVQIILYDLTMEAPDLEDARIWAEHFGLDRNPNVYVAFSERDLRGRASSDMIPGFFLVDKGSVVRYDATGHRPRHNLFTQVLPQIARMVRN